ncbi:MAG: Bro-N domain-containing protein [Gemmobacter sp.]
MGEVIPFDFEELAVRVIMVDEAPWFVAADVCRALGISKYRDAIARLDDDERVSVLVDTLGGQQSMSAVSESGLYALILTSRKPAAKRFRKWVTAQVLPAIRRTGQYRVAAPVAAPRLAGAEEDRLTVNRAYLSTLSAEHQATAHARAAIMRQIAAMVEAGTPRGAAMEAASFEFGIPKSTLYNHLRLIRMVPEADWPVALAPQWNKGALIRLANRALSTPNARRRA